MTEQLKNLWNKAMKLTNETVSTELSDYYLVHEQVQRENFAKLIVAECANAADMAYDARCKYPGDYVGEQMGCGKDEGIATWRSMQEQHLS
jgi:hypothetical protein